LGSISTFATINSTCSSPLQLVHWNCRGASGALPEILCLAKDFQVICIQETILLPVSNFRIPGFTCVRKDINSPGARGLCTAIRTDFCFSVVDINHLSHSSLEMHAILLQCSLDSPVLIINMYRHPNARTPFSFYDNLFSAISSYKYILVVGDLNAHHHAWGDPRMDCQGDAIMRACDAHSMVVINDGSSTFISSSGHASSVIDLTIASRDLGLLATANTLRDLHGSDHYPVSVSIVNASPSRYCFSNRLNFTDKHLVALHSRLVSELPRFLTSISAVDVSSNPLHAYDTFCSFLTDNISTFFSQGTLLPRRKVIPANKSPSPWWNSKCAEAVESRSTLLRLYKASPSLENWLAYKRGNMQCRKILRRKKRKGWRLLCSEFSFKTPTAAIWRFMRAYKNKSLRSVDAFMDDDSKIRAQDQLLEKLCPPSCLHLDPSLPANLESETSQNNPIGWIDNPLTCRDMELAIQSSRRKSSPGLDRFDYGIIRALPSEMVNVLLDIYNGLYSLGLFPESWRSSLLTFVPKPDGRSPNRSSFLFLKDIRKDAVQKIPVGGGDKIFAPRLSVRIQEFAVMCRQFGRSNQSNLFLFPQQRLHGRGLPRYRRSI